MGRKPKPDAASVGPLLPDAIAYLWGWFAELSMGLASNGMGPMLVTWEALRAWAGQMRMDLEPWECRALVQLGHMRAVIESEKKPTAPVDARSKRARHNSRR